ncbi:hypothetical protein SteCoe_7175 [Stentor coeruleus]|uniref:Uncharacterized protein n=1 Tax=Stentor coeruleus TaxID=5963 RepID=A0A1R2CN77_9CILI|nr:hypothetical protein SteCoe_7175 [Stentor coeruleus]
MDFYKKRTMSSKQGKAINHMYPTLFAESLKRPKVQIQEPTPVYDLKEMLHDLETQRVKSEEEAQKSVSEQFTSSFKAVSRDQHSFVTRNKTGAPRVGLYNPLWASVKPRTSQALRFSSKPCKKRDPHIFTPSCIENDLNCTFPRRQSADIVKPSMGKYDKNLKRTITNIKQYNEKVKEKLHDIKEIPKKPFRRAPSPIKFSLQLSRKEFVTEKDPPNDKRFDFSGSISLVHSNNRRVKSFCFEKSEERGQLFHLGLSIPPYDKDEEKIMQRLNVSVMEFNKLTERKDLILEHQLLTPHQVDFDIYDDAFMKQSTVRGPTNLPLMSTITPRDDLMYRVKDTYAYNVPEIQTSDAKPQYQGSVPVSVIKEKFKSQCSVYSKSKYGTF